MLFVCATEAAIAGQAQGEASEDIEIAVLQGGYKRLAECSAGSLV